MALAQTVLGLEPGHDLGGLGGGGEPALGRLVEQLLRGEAGLLLDRVEVSLVALTATLGVSGAGSFSETARTVSRGRVHAIAKWVGTCTTRGCAARYSLGDWPTMSRNVRLKVPRLEKPTAMQTSVTERSVETSMAIARSTRRRCR